MKKILLYTLLTVSVLFNVFAIYIIVTQNPMKVEGQMSWIDIYSNNSDATIKFLNNTLDVKVSGTNKPENIADDDFDYRILKANKAVFPFAGIMQITDKYKKDGLKPHSTIYLTVKNYDETSQKFIKNGAKPILENLRAKNMKFGFYKVPGGVEIGIVQYLK